MLLTEFEWQGKWWSSFLSVIGIFITAEILLAVAIIIIELFSEVLNLKLVLENLESIFENTFFSLLSFLLILGVTIFFTKKINRRLLKSLGFFREYLFRAYSLGAVIGTIECLLVLVVCW